MGTKTAKEDGEQDRNRFAFGADGRADASGHGGG